MAAHTWSLDDVDDDVEGSAFAGGEEKTPERPSISNDGVLSMGDVDDDIMESAEAAQPRSIFDGGSVRGC
jgi:hypothetical protein